MSNIVPYNFHGDQIDVVREGDDVSIPIKRVCEHLGLNHGGQLRGLQRRTWASVHLKCIESGRGERQVACIPLKALPMWLATIEPSRVHKDHRKKLGLYQDECAEALRAYFFGAPKLTIERREFVLEFGHGKRIGEDPKARAEMVRVCAATARATNRSVQAVHGAVRRFAGIPGVYQLSVFLWTSIREFLSDLALAGSFSSPTKCRALPPSDPRQTNLF